MIYLDSAATTMQKPASVLAAVSRAMNCMASPGRGSHRPAMRAAETVFQCREAAARLFDVDQPDHVVFTSCATHGLNIAIKSAVKPGSSVLITGYEHNAVTRPLKSIPNLLIRVAESPLFRPDILLDHTRKILKSGVHAMVCTHVSNVFGYVLPIKEISELCKENGVPLIVDASQSAGCLPISMKEWCAEFIAMPGHKGLYGPQGTGLLLCAGDKVKPLIEGGTGSASAIQTMPEFLPDRLEAGTHNVPGIAGLLEGLKFVEEKGVSNILEHERKLALRAARGLERMTHVEVFFAPGLKNQTGVVSFRIDGIDCEAVAEQLGRADLAVRAGLHCAPLAHQSAGTMETGTVRISLSAFNTLYDVERLVEVMSREFA